MTNPYTAPTQGQGPEPVPPQGASTWPKIIGILSITLGALGFMNYACNAGGAMMSGMMFDIIGESVSQADQGMPEDVVALLEAQKIPSLISAILGFILSTCLIVIGIAVLNRRRWSRTALVIWSLAKIVHAVIATAMGYISMTAMSSVMEDKDVQFEKMDSLIQLFGAMAMVFTFLFLTAYPLFLLIWMNRGKVVDEVANWR